MFGGGSSNPYDEVVTKTTDENLTSENWELILNLCDKVQEEGQEGAHNVIAALLKRLAHRNPNVQLYALSLSESLSKNCDIQLHREIASRAFTQGLEKLIVDRTTHEKVRQRALGLIAMWTAEFENDSTLGIMEDCYKGLQAKSYRFETPQEAPPPTVDDEIRRKEEEDLQRVLALSIEDKGGRGQWGRFDAGPGGSSSSAAATSSSHAAPSSSSYGPTYAGGYAPARTPSPTVAHPSMTMPVATPASGTVMNAATTGGIVTRVRALHTFEPTEPGELGFEKGDIIKVVDRGYKDWWRGQLKGRTGIFPVNYVEAMPEPTAAELGREAEQEATVFAQAVNVEKLLTMLRQLDPSKDNLADNEEIQELYRSSMALRPKIVKLIDKYSQKRADLVSMNETFVRARTIFDRMMEESLARHSGMYEQGPQGAYRPPTQPFQRPESAYGYGQQQPYPASTPGAYPGGPQPYAYGPAPYGQPQPAYAAYGAQPYAGQPASGPGTPGAQQQQHPGQMPPGPQPGPAQAGPQHQGPIPAHQSAPQHGPIPGQQGPMPGQQGPLPGQQGGPQQDIAQTQPGYQGPGAAQPAQQAQNMASQQAQPERQVISPYVYDPNTVYADPNVQAWAQYYAKGGKDLAGAVYFISVPGVTDDVPPQAAEPPQQQQHLQQQQQPVQQSFQQPFQQQQPAQQQQPVQQQQPIQQQQQPAQQQPLVQQQQPIQHAQPIQQQEPPQQPYSASGHSSDGHGRSSLEVLPSPFPEDAVRASSPPQMHPQPYAPVEQYSSPPPQQHAPIHEPQQYSSPPPQSSYQSAPPQQSPVQPASTPSWVLPKTPRSPPSFGGAQPPAQGSYTGVGTTA